MFRNNLIVWFFSVFFELLERSLSQYLPNFYECWWDSLFLDLFGCNLFGILIGTYLLKKLRIDKFHWIYSPLDKEENSDFKIQNFKNSLEQLDEYKKQDKWHFLLSPINFLIFVWFLILNTLGDLSFFILKKALNIPASHPIVIIKTVVFGLFSITVCKDYYQYMQQKNCNRIIPISVYLFHYILISDYFIAFRNLPS